ncbi:hypothetical protein [Reichenbachiella versicolor]|uniref:hypothetical protein n=1 Tax=Reichenbachiella versicolor TaxID=1821036 RepID=UPI001C87541C|nr:hypothetical protein [Reichenbachiella versicolor]
MKCKIRVFLLLFSCFLMNQATAQNSTDAETKIKQYIKQNHPDAEFKNFVQRKWGDYSVQFKTSETKWGRCSASGSFDKKGELIEISYWIWKLPQEIVDREKSLGLKTIKKKNFTLRADGQNYYLVQDIQDKIVLFNEDFKRLRMGPMEEGLKLTGKIKKDLHHRFDSPFILSGKKFNSGRQTDIQLSITYRLDNSYNQEGRVIYTLDGDWVSTFVYMKEYVKLPLELIMFVEERGGIENFDWIQQYFSPEESYYDLWFKDNTTLKLDENLNPINN